jgi:hypothetical protein
MWTARGWNTTKVRKTEGIDMTIGHLPGSHDPNFFLHTRWSVPPACCALRAPVWHLVLKAAFGRPLWPGAIGLLQLVAQVGPPAEVGLLDLLLVVKLVEEYVFLQQTHRASG